MDLNRLFNMLTRMFIRSATKAGVDHAARKGKPEAGMTPEERQQARRARDLATRAQKAQQLVRRLWR
ncbi:hypothetical protein [Rhodobacter calidifons]|uniref:Uncharacterized protein n=1 Tax=Rhodobacter calidifons TaxID=2715277 RepID=A0ABX0G6J5_9RHOB|nr:hypothetical protein [Rhodobacter calidifons]NHB76835.1 hypothetical protein [Rhodobacter calidifons]